MVASAVHHHLALLTRNIAILTTSNYRANHKVFPDLLPGADLIRYEALLVHEVGVSASLQQYNCYFYCPPHRAVMQRCVTLHICLLQLSTILQQQFYDVSLGVVSSRLEQRGTLLEVTLVDVSSGDD